MKIDQKMLNRLLSMNDAQLGEVIRSIAAETGIDGSQLGIDPNHIAGIRQALGSATETDLAQLNALYESYRNQKKR